MAVVWSNRIFLTISVTADTESNAEIVIIEHRLRRGLAQLRDL